MTSDEFSSGRIGSGRSRAVIPIPPELDALMRLANLLPTWLRGSRKIESDHVTILPWRVSEEAAIVSWPYFLRFVDRLPVGLQAFVLHDDEGLYIAEGDKEFPKCDEEFPIFDPDHHQRYQNLHLTTESDDALYELVSKAKERVRREMEVVNEKMVLRDNKNSVLSSDQLNLSLIGNWCRIGITKFRTIGPRTLFSRAHERFWFVLAVDQILDALTDEEPQSKVDSERYLSESGALTSHLLIENGRVQLSPPILFSYLIGLEISRIRHCELCGNYFWAGRKDKIVCSIRCGATIRKRKERKLGRQVSIERNDASSAHQPKVKTGRSRRKDK